MLKETLNRTETRESVEFEVNGEKIFGIFHRPILAKTPYPSVIISHGMAGHKTGRYRVYVDLAKELSKIGFGVLRFDFRGSGDSEGDFGSITLQDQVDDLLEAIKWVRKDPHVDKNRVGLFGRSFGGTIAVIAAAEAADIKSIALWAPLFSAQQWKDKWDFINASTSDPEKIEEFRTINGQVGGLEFYDNLFNLDITPYIQKLSKVPFLHIHGLKDTNVFPSHAHDYEKARRGAEINAFIKLENTDHDFTHRKERFQAIEETCSWFEKTLK